MNYPDNPRSLMRKSCSIKKQQHDSNSSSGFTLIEMVMVIVLISILAIAVVPKFTSPSFFSMEGATSQVAADIRYTQELAMASHDSKKIDFSAGTTYSLKNSDDSVIRTVNLPSGASISSTTFTITGTDVLSFNTLGEPSEGGSVSVASSGESPRTITVTQYTGKVTY